MNDSGELKYKHLCIFEKGDAILPRDASECFLDACTYDLMLVENACLGDPEKEKAAGIVMIGEMGFGLKVYQARQLRGRIMNINDPELWEILVLNGFLDWGRETSRGNPLQWALSQEHIRNEKIFDILYAKFPDTDLAKMFWHTATIEAVEWLDREPHKADRNYPGLRCSMREAVAMNRFRDTPAILEYLYGEKDKNKEENADA